MAKITKISGGILSVYKDDGSFYSPVTNRVQSAQIDPTETRLVLVNESRQAEVWSINGSYLHPIARDVSDARWSGDNLVIYFTDGRTCLYTHSGSYIRNL